ncbi:PAS domain S-box protein [Ramlibacter sp. MAHUQ-53]|uniref:PAS domain-containing hybrid sensor histidine kinase/response regulator n=1 Tax=unclassified Ramlibacter TaxID=2617605 RepID=UPI003637F462
MRARLAAASRLLAGAVVVIGLAGLAGWWFDLPPLRQPFPGHRSIAPNGALALALGGLAVLALHRRGDPRWRRTAAGLGWAVCALGLASLAQVLSGVDLRLDGLLLPGGRVAGVPDARIAPVTALGVALCGACIAWPATPAARRWRPVVPLVVLFLGVGALTVHVYGAERVASLRPFTGVALHAAFGLVMLAFAVLFARPGEGWTARLSAVGAEGVLWRTLPALVVLVPLVMALLQRLGAAYGLYERAIGDALFTLLMLLVMIVLVLRVARHAAAIDRRVREALEGAPVGMLVVDRQGAIELVNARAERLFARARGKLVGRPVEALLPGVALRGPGAGPAGEGRELAARRADGTDVPVEVGVAPLTGADGDRYLVSLVDLTARQRTQRELQAREREFSATFEQAAVGIAHLALDGRILRVNRRYCDIVGYTPEELVGSDFRDHTHPEDLQDGQALRARFVTGAIATYQRESRVVRRDGRVAWVEVTASMVSTPEGVPDHAVVLIADIDARKAAEAQVRQAQAEIRRINTGLEHTVAERTAQLLAAKEEAERANRAKDTLLANVSHEIRTPLNAILGAAQVLERGAQGDQLQVLVRGIRSAGRSLVSVINDLLDLAKIEAGRFEIVHQPVRLQEVLASLAEALQPSAREKGLEFEVHPVRGDLPAVMGDPQRLGQVLYNLAGNAIKFTERGRVDVRLEVLRREEDRLHLRLSVSDTGPGIPPALRPHLFAPFAQAEEVTRNQLGGTGLGLAICRQLVTLMGGEIDVRSEPGQGSEFWFTLGLPVAAVAPPEVPAQAPEPGAQRLAGMRLLVVDDADINREVARLLLEGEGARVEMAGDGAQALERLRERPADFDAVLMDVQMPVMDGLEAVRAIRADPALAGLPVIALTAGAMSNQREEALKAGMDDYITKPFEMEQMVARLRVLAAAP